MTNSEALTSIFYKPRETFKSLEEDGSWFLAAFLFFVLSCAIWMVPAAWTHSVSAPPPVVESNQQFDSRDQNPAESGSNRHRDTSVPSQLEINNIINQSAETTPFWYKNWLTFITILFVPFTFIFLFSFLFIEALYFRLIGSFVSPEFTVGDWYRFSIWSRVPATSFSVIFTVLALITGLFEPSISPNDGLSLARWLEMPDAYLRNGIFSMRTVDVGLVWVVVLQTIGIREWCCTSTISSCVIAVTPVVLFYAISTLWFYTIGGL